MARRSLTFFLVFPWLAQGHINPFLELSQALAIHGHTVSFLSTPLNISRIKQSLQLGECPGRIDLLELPLSTPLNISRIKQSLQLGECPGRIDLLELPLPPTEGLTPGAECKTDIPVEMTLLLKKVMDGMEKSFQSLLGQLSPDYPVFFFMQSWAQRAASEMRVPAIYFCVFSAELCSRVFHPEEPRPRIS